MQSNITRAINLFKRYGVWSQEEIAAIMCLAFSDARKFPAAQIQSFNRDDHSPNKMRFFFYRLEQRIQKYGKGESTKATKKTCKPSVAGAAPVCVAPSSLGMTQDQAEELAEEILRDAASDGVTEAIIQEGKDGWFVVLTWQGIRRTMSSPEEWQAEWAMAQSITKCLSERKARK